MESLEDYLLVNLNHGVSELRRNIHLNHGDTLQLYLGHFIGKKITSGFGGTTNYFLEDIRFCIF